MYFHFASSFIPLRSIMFRCFVLVLLVVAASAFAPLRSTIHSLTAANLAVGEVAPDFELESTTTKKAVKLSQFKGKKPVVVFFYPNDNSPGCTKEACAFEKKAPDFKKLGAEVIGISKGKAEDKQKFINDNNLNSMTLCIDSDDATRKSWKVPKALFGAFPGRVTYVLDKTGKCVSVYDDLAKAELHPDKALEALSNMQGGAKKGVFSF